MERTAEGPPMATLAWPCPHCGAQLTVEGLMADPAVEPIGLLLDAYLFNHACREGGTTLTVPAEAFAPWMKPAGGAAQPILSDGCEGRCTDLDDLGACAQPCVNVPSRRFLAEVLMRKAL